MDVVILVLFRENCPSIRFYRLLSHLQLMLEIVIGLEGRLEQRTNGCPIGVGHRKVQCSLRRGNLYFVHRDI